MTDQKNLPRKTLTRDVAVLTEPRGSLVSRGLAAIHSIEKQHLSLTTEANAEKLFRQGMRYRYGEDYIQADRSTAFMDSDGKAREYFTEAAELDHAEAQYELSLLLGEYSEEDEQLEWLENSANLGFGPALYWYWMGFEPSNDVEHQEWEQGIEKAFVWYKERAQAGDAQRQFEFAEIHLRGEAYAANRADGLRWLKASAAQDYRPACRLLGNEYLLSVQVTEHTTERGIYWLTHAVDLGDIYSCHTLGDLYLYGHARARQGRLPTLRIAPDKKAAIAWYERGIAMGDRGMAYRLGRHYLTGEHLDQDLQLAEKWLLHSAMEDEFSLAHNLLGEEYASGARLRQDTNAAIRWLELAAENSRFARRKLAEIYLDGKIIPKNFEAAIKWLTHAADGGLRNNPMKIVAEKCFDGRFNAAEEPAAQAWMVQMTAMAHESVVDTEDVYAAHNACYLAELYELGLGVAQDMDKAIYWYKQSAEQDLYRAKTRLNELGIDWETT